jgi:hypothetical protein
MSAPKSLLLCAAVLFRTAATGALTPFIKGFGTPKGLLFGP